MIFFSLSSARKMQRAKYAIDLSKAIGLVSRDGLFKNLTKNFIQSCPLNMKSLIQSFHISMWGTKQYGNMSEAFKIFNGFKQGFIPAPTLFGIFFSLLLKHTFGTAEEGIYLHTRIDGNLFNPSRLKAKSKVKNTTIRDMMFADDFAVAAHSPTQL